MILWNKSTIIDKVVKAIVRDLGEAQMFDPLTGKFKGTRKMFDMSGQWVSSAKPSDMTREDIKKLREHDRQHQEDSTQPDATMSKITGFGDRMKDKIKNIINTWRKT